MFEDAYRYVTHVMTPDSDSLHKKYGNEYVKKSTAKLKKEGVTISFTNLGEAVEGASRCNCAKPSAYVLFTTYLSLESPISCLDCLGCVPLYKFPVMASGEFYEVMSWQSDYQSCDSLQMHCTVLESAATRQISQPGSSLSKSGLRICSELSGSVGTPFYYYLYRGKGRSLASEMKRNCPSCGEPWAGEKSQDSIFDFKCKKCLLVSNIAWNVR
jgi:predicted  nucleic acid-binding Zn ribbon protein